jgi:hypothetical protein
MFTVAAIILLSLYPSRECPTPRRDGTMLIRALACVMWCIDRRSIGLRRSMRQTPAAKLAVIVDNSPNSMMEGNTDNNDTCGIQNDQNPHPLPHPECIDRRSIGLRRSMRLGCINCSRRERVRMRKWMGATRVRRYTRTKQAGVRSSDSCGEISRHCR